MSRRIYVAIMKAAEEGCGLHLTASEVYELSRDDAVSAAASNHVTPTEEAAIYKHGWKAVKP